MRRPPLSLAAASDRHGDDPFLLRCENTKALRIIKFAARSVYATLRLNYTGEQI